MNLQHVQEQLVGQGYAPIAEREYVQLPAPVAPSVHPATIQVQDRSAVAVKNDPAAEPLSNIEARRAPLEEGIAQWWAVLTQKNGPSAYGPLHKSETNSMATMPQPENFEAGQPSVRFGEWIIGGANSLIEHIAGQ